MAEPCCSLCSSREAVQQAGQEVLQAVSSVLRVKLENTDLVCQKCRQQVLIPPTSYFHLPQVQALHSRMGKYLQHLPQLWPKLDKVSGEGVGGRCSVCDKVLGEGEGGGGEGLTRLLEEEGESSLLCQPCQGLVAQWERASMEVVRLREQVLG